MELVNINMLLNMKSFNLKVLACAVVVRAEKESGHVEKFKSY